MTRSNWADLVRESGGRWFLSIRPWWWAGPIWVMLSVFATENQRGAPGFWPLLLWNTLGVAGAVGFLAVLGLTIFRNRFHKPVSLWLMMVIGASAGAIKFVIFTSGMAWSQHFLPNNDIWRFINLSLVAALIVPGISVIYTFRDQLTAIRRQLVRENVRSYLADSKALASTGNPELEAFISSARSSVEKARNPQELATALEKIINSDLKPLTKRLWKSAEQSVTPIGTVDLLGIALTSHRFLVLPTLFTYLVSFSVVQISAVGWVEGLGRLLVQSVVLVSVLFATSKFPKKSAAVGTGVFFATNLALAFLITYVTNAIFGQLPYLPEIPAVLVLTAFFIGISLVFGVISAGLTGRTQLINEIGRLEIERERRLGARSSLQFQQRELAQLLHSQVQNQMLNSALRLSRADIKDFPSYSAEREFLDLLLDDLANHSSLSNSQDLTVSLSEIASQWQSLVELQIQTKIDFRPSASQSRAITLVVNEAITNAVRHGDADTIEILIRPNSNSADAIEVACSANGKAPNPTTKGLGFELYETLSDGNWSLRSAEAGRGSELTVRLKNQQASILSQ